MELAFLNYMVVHGLCAGILGMMGIYLLTSKRSAYEADIEPNMLVRKTAGWNAMLWTLTFAAPLFLPFIENLPYGYMLRSVDIMLSMLIVPGMVALLLSLLQLPYLLRRLLWLSIILPVCLIVWYVISPGHLPIYLTFGYWSVYALLFALWFIRKERVYRRHLKDLYSDVEQRDVRWIYLFIALLFGYLALYIIAHIRLQYGLSILSYLYCLVMWFFLVRHVESHASVVQFWLGVEEAPQGEIEEEKEDESPQPTNLDWLGDLLKQKCEDKGLFLRHDLTVDVLASHVGTNRTYISRYLATKGITYYGYINKLRIAHAKLLIEEQPDASVSVIAFQCGFKSESTFRRAFVEIEKCTPKEYAKRK